MLRATHARDIILVLAIAVHNVVLITLNCIIGEIQWKIEKKYIMTIIFNRGIGLSNSTA
jgi:hypothetical protein